MKPAIVMPMADPTGRLFQQLIQILPDLKRLFDVAILSIPPKTHEKQTTYIEQLKSDSFCDLLFLPDGMSVGEEFLRLYEYAAQISSPKQLLHLCFIDRIAFTLQSEYQAQFCDDIQQLITESTPLLYQRSEQAWQTHPTNYYQLEQMVTTVGALLFGQRLDFAWCHIVVEAQRLLEILPHFKSDTLTMMAEMILLLREDIKTKEVDWLAWEDPFIFEQDAVTLKAEREGSLIEMQKRLGYVLPMLEMLKSAGLDRENL